MFKSASFIAESTRYFSGCLSTVLRFSHCRLALSPQRVRICLDSESQSRVRAWAFQCLKRMRVVIPRAKRLEEPVRAHALASFELGKSTFPSDFLAERATFPRDFWGRVLPLFVQNSASACQKSGGFHQEKATRGRYPLFGEISRNRRVSIMPGHRLMADRRPLPAFRDSFL